MATLSTVLLFTISVQQYTCITVLHGRCRHRRHTGTTGRNICAKSRGLGQAKPEPGRQWWLWLGPGLDEAGAPSGQAKATAFGPSRAGTPLPDSPR
jgi:hypothetical protein